MNTDQSSLCDLLILFGPFHAYPVDKIEQEQRDERKKGDEQERTDIPQIGDHDIAIISDAGDDREHLLVS